LLLRVFLTPPDGKRRRKIPSFYCRSNIYTDEQKIKLLLAKGGGKAIAKKRLRLTAHIDSQKLRSDPEPSFINKKRA